MKPSEHYLEKSSKTWVEGHMREGSPVKGHFRRILGTVGTIIDPRTAAQGVKDLGHVAAAGMTAVDADEYGPVSIKTPKRKWGEGLPRGYKDPMDAGPAAREKPVFKTPQEALRWHVSGAVERGEKEAITEKAPKKWGEGLPKGYKDPMDPGPATRAFRGLSPEEQKIVRSNLSRRMQAIDAAVGERARERLKGRSAESPGPSTGSGSKYQSGVTNYIEAKEAYDKGDPDFWQGIHSSDFPDYSDDDLATFVARLTAQIEAAKNKDTSRFRFMVDKREDLMQERMRRAGLKKAIDDELWKRGVPWLLLLHGE